MKLVIGATYREPFATSNESRERIGLNWRRSPAAASAGGLRCHTAFRNACHKPISRALSEIEHVHPSVARHRAPPIASDHGRQCAGGGRCARHGADHDQRSEEHTSELQSLMRISYAVFGLKKKKHEQNR